MVHIKRVELTNFKSFGGTTAVPLLPGFTVVSGPNGSGKSNILDALLFALGLSSSKGMRAERLPDLVNNAQSRKGTVETLVTVTFDLSDYDGEPLGSDSKEIDNSLSPETETETSETRHGTSLPGDDLSIPNYEPPSEWTVARKLRVTKQGTYTSTYYINGEACTQTELHEQLNKLRIYPEGYNVVLQGDVTGIITMKPRERREIIDELAGVASFDRKITLAKEKLDAVKDREERSRIVEQELIAQRDRLDKDRAKAEKYQQLREEFQQKSQWETVLNYQTLQQQQGRLREQIEADDRTLTDLNEQRQHQDQQIQTTSVQLEKLNALVKAMGEEELIALQSSLATQEAQQSQLQTRSAELETAIQQTITQIHQTEQELRQHYQALDGLAIEKDQETLNLGQRQRERDSLQTTVERGREATSEVAQQAESWMVQQTELHRQIETLQKTLDPHRTEQARLRERVEQLQRQLSEQQQSVTTLAQELSQKTIELQTATNQRDGTAQRVATLTQQVTEVETELQVQQETQTRLLQEQRERQRKLDKSEAQHQAQQEATGSYATKIIAQSGISGICGLVCQLGQVEPQYQLALETSAGARLGNIVVEDDSVAAAAIEFLKRQQAGRATFLPLNKIKGNRSNLPNLATMRNVSGLIDLAVNLIEYEPRYQDIFAYVFGNTLVFNNLSNARKVLGQYRIVTLEGELLETTGAMTGGSVASRSSLHFGTDQGSAEARNIAALKERLEEIERILERCNRSIIEASQTVKERALELNEARQTLRDHQQQVSLLESEIRTLNNQQEQLRSQLEKNTQEFNTAQIRLKNLEAEIPNLETKLQQDRELLAQLEDTHSHSEWQQLQGVLRTQETELQQKENALRTVQQRLTEIENQQTRLQEKNQAGNQKLEATRQEQKFLTQKLETVKNQLAEIHTTIQQIRGNISKVEAKLGEEKRQRDQIETNLGELRLAKQQLDWQIEKLQETQAGRREQLTIKLEQIAAIKIELPEPLPNIPNNLDLAALQRDLRSLQKRMEALEPVNMLALEEFERTQTRLEELTQKLTTLEGERTELLLRIENFTTLRRRAFQEAFDAVNENFQTIFAQLSEGDGYLEIDNPEDPFTSGLNLIAHPKGKPVQRLTSMSGGEKSLTALSFIFALQKYRPSPFYAFDEVDMFLDGSNVERLARMIKSQTEQAQFLVVSLRRPMMEASQRTIGVTQARGAYTQVLGIKL
ncbi:Chromosome partition protein Smc [Planktothrix sp. PCC 11201]|uniref:chromosome segregation protein SMC n=1 Tax=Planktothrix sp. PCC 11201 TaxID=1729650 RepID=UPI00091178C0|nr:chromosome segregation protein SMC [Planktothrix sp. PCC 11201]SKB14824.1 Chromosome partition protein Smc [Planktothrix sp. PCC 11201]